MRKKSSVGIYDEIKKPTYSSIKQKPYLCKHW